MNSRKKIRVAVIGVGYLGRLHALKYPMIDEAALVGVTDRDFKRAEEIARETGSRAYADYREFFGRVDAVSIVTPTESHCRIGLDFLSRGVDVMMEKPIAAHSGEAAELIKAAEKSNSVLQVGHLERFNAAVAEANSGRIKDPVYVETQRLAPFPNRGTDVDVILDLMIHDIDIVLDMVKSEIASVEASGMPVISGKLDFANARIKFKSGCTASLTASRVSRDKVRRLNIFQPGSLLAVDYALQQLRVSRIVPDAHGGFSTLVEEAPELEKKDAILEELKAFVRSSSARSAAVVSGQDGKRALEVAEMIQARAADGLKGFKLH